MERKEKEVRWKSRIKMPAMTSFNHQVAAQGNVQPVVLGYPTTPPLPFPSEKPHSQAGAELPILEISKPGTHLKSSKKQNKTKKKDKLIT